jgi:glycine/D-amino acid oxidase-like deaminating enzyme
MAQAMLPDYRDPCGWNVMLPPREPRPAARGTIRLRYAVVGAGYTGLAVARRLRELDPEASIGLFEGSVVGEGSSARNSGFMSPTDSKIGLSIDQMDRAERLNTYSTEGFLYLKDLMDRHAIACDLERVGRITAAATELGVNKINGMIDGAIQHGFAHQALDREAIAQVIGSHYYARALRVEEGYLLQPAALVRGLADALPEDVAFYEQSPVLDLSAPDQTGGVWTLRTAEAEIVADRVILATNASVKKFGFWRDRLVTIYTFAGISEAMDAQDAASLGEPAWGVLPAHRLGTTMRRVGPNRLMVRSLYAYERPLDQATVREALTGCFHRRYPALRHVPLHHIWGGTTALTMNGSPRWGQIRPGLYASAGCNGSGIVKGTLLGKRLAESIVTGDPQEDLQAVFGRANLIAPEPFRTIGFHVISTYQRRRAGAEM